MTEYTALVEQAKKLNLGGFCCVIAYSLITGASIQKAHSELVKLGQNKKGLPLTREDYEQGFNTKLIKSIKNGGYNLTKVQCNSKTVRTLERNIKTNKTLLVFTSNAQHVLVVKDKKILDWSAGRCKRISGVFLVERV